MTNISDFLAGSDYERHETFKFDTVGKTIGGTIATAPRIVNTRDLNGGDSDKLVVDITTPAGDTYSVWIKKGLMAKAVADAVKAAGETQLAEGGTFQLTHSGVGQPSQPGYNPPKLFEAKYKAPAAGVAVSDLFPDE